MRQLCEEASCICDCGFLGYLCVSVCCRLRRNDCSVITNVHATKAWSPSALNKDKNNTHVQHAKLRFVCDCRHEKPRSWLERFQALNTRQTNKTIREPVL